MHSFLSKIFCGLRTFRGKRYGIAFLILLLCLGSFFLVGAVTDPYGCRILEDVTLDGVDLGGMTKWEARKALKSAAEETILSQPLVVELPNETLTLNPKEIKLKLDVRQAVADAYALGRSTDSSADLNSGLSVYLRFDETAVFQNLLRYASAHDTQLTQPVILLEGTLPDLTEAGFDPQAPAPVLSVTLGTPEAHLDAGAVLLQIKNLYQQGISALRNGTYRLTVEASAEQLPKSVDVEALYAEFAVPCKDAQADLENYKIVPATYGLGFDREEAQNAIDAAAYGETVTIPMGYQTPEIFSDAVPFRDVLGHCETRHTDDENRNTNLRLVCETLNGYILQPGEEFSYNGVIGERTEERGFKAAGAYSGTRLVKDIGGGVCQGSSTLYNCVLLADLEVTERVCHGLLVNYLPIGMDAAVNWSTKTDFKFRNNFHFPIQIQAKLEDGYMKMQIVGIDEKDYYVQMRSGRSDEELRIYSNSYKYKYSKETGELLSKELEARSSYMYFSS